MKHIIKGTIVVLFIGAALISCRPAEGTPKYEVNEAWRAFRDTHLAVIDAKNNNDSEQVRTLIMQLTNTCSSNYYSSTYQSENPTDVLKLVRGITFANNLQGIRLEGNTATGRISGGGMVTFVRTDAGWKVDAVN